LAGVTRHPDQEWMEQMARNVTMEDSGFLINRYPQDDHERLLIEKLKDAGCEVEWGVSECEWVRAEARAHFFETDGENFSTTT
jgi:hypothetical protein